jgi:hypothetical protein
MALPSQFVTKVLARFMSEKELNKMNKNYIAAKHTRGGMKYEATEFHLSLCRQWIADKITIEEAAKAMGCGKHTAGLRFAKIIKKSYGK